MSEAKNQGGFYYIEVRPKEDYKTFRTHDVGDKDGIERVGGQRADGSWETVKWLVSKKMARVENGRLVADHPEAKKLFDELGLKPKLIEGNCFEATDRVDNADV